MSKKTPDALPVEPPSIFDVPAAPSSTPAADPVEVAGVGKVAGEIVKGSSRRTGFEFRHTSWGF